MIPIVAPQGSKAWKRARAGVITASIFKRVSGAATDAWHDMAFKLAVERVTGEPMDEGHEGWAAARGHEMEPEARLAHQAELHAYVQPVGFALVDRDWWFGCSADGLISTDGGAEYKAFLDPAKARKIIVQHDFADIEHQALGCMWVTDRQWWDMCLYLPALASVGQDFIRHRVHRNQDAIYELVEGLIPFQRQVAEYEEWLRHRGRQLGFNPPSIEVQRQDLLPLVANDSQLEQTA